MERKDYLRLIKDLKNIELAVHDMVDLFALIVCKGREIIKTDSIIEIENALTGELENLGENE